MKRVLKWVGDLRRRAPSRSLLLAAARRLRPAPEHGALASGSLAIAGLSAPVEVVRDSEGVPHIFAKSMEDLLGALGFLHAQDRLWQMELTRRTGQGRLSEIFGERTFTTDVFLRTLDLYGHAERSLRRAAAGGAPQPRGLRARRQCLHDPQDRAARAAPAARVPAVAPSAGAVAPGRQHRHRPS